MGKVVATVLAAALLAGAVVAWRRHAKSQKKDTYVPGPGPMLDPDVPIKHPHGSWDAFYAFFDRS